MNERTNKVENGAVARLIRTVGFFLVLVASLFLGIKALGAINVEFIKNLIKPIEDVINTDLLFLVDHIYLVFLAGVLLLVWTQSRSYFLRVFTTVVALLITYVVNSVPTTFEVELFVDVNNLIPFLNGSQAINNILIDFFSITKWLVLIIAFPILILFILFGYKKPKRISTNFLSNGLVLLFLTVIVIYLPGLLDLNWYEANWFAYVVYSLLSLSFIVTSLGSAFGVLGLFRK